MGRPSALWSSTREKRKYPESIQELFWFAKPRVHTGAANDLRSKSTMRLKNASLRFGQSSNASCRRLSTSFTSAFARPRE